MFLTDTGQILFEIERYSAAADSLESSNRQNLRPLSVAADNDVIDLCKPT